MLPPPRLVALRAVQTSLLPRLPVLPPLPRGALHGPRRLASALLHTRDAPVLSERSKEPDFPAPNVRGAARVGAAAAGGGVCGGR